MLAGWGGKQGDLVARMSGAMSVEGGRERTVDNVLVSRCTLLCDANQLVNLILHPPLKHLHFLQNHPCFDRSIDAVAGARPASRTDLGTEWSIWRGTFCERMTYCTTGGEEGEGLEVGEQ